MGNSSSTAIPTAANLTAAMQLGFIIRGVVLAAALGGLAAVVAVTGAHLDRAATAAARVDEPVYLPRAEYLRPISLGWQNVLADILWFRTISYFGEHYRSDRTYAWLAQMCDLVTDLDPRAEHVYRFAGLILPWEANDVDEGIRLLEKGVRNLPESWLLHYYLGMTHYFFRNDADAAAEYLSTAARLPGAPPLVTRVAALMSGRRRNRSRGMPTLTCAGASGMRPEPFRCFVTSSGVTPSNTARAFLF